ncbi:LysR family transcriptional regulator [Candidimonas sp. SYP-B2681]|uniref:TOBE domain-containing protein n=1 Tax=Candidimonas sp. SYP-B2681 TaxID=2497686 RepID=UPI000F88F2E2|nr:TOBE domain-containing protein [Candidimonas sp. SYP-B2681]RTZ44693.1 LysR family transcriptional regulator [Candidimonas sp. SYP-B2681]
MTKSNSISPNAPAIELSGAISLRSGQHSWGNQKRMALLDAIGQEGSITAAARKIGLSYKAAWDAVDTMNNLAGEALVLRSIGGPHGGGAKLTKRAHELIRLYQAVNQEHKRFIALLSRANNECFQNLELMQHMMIETSARNKLLGVVDHISPGAINDEVALTVGDGIQIIATISKESVQSLDLYPGKRAIAFIQASSVIVGLPGGDLRLSARNQLQGTVNRIVTGAVNAEVSIALEQGQIIAAMLSKESLESMDLKEEQAAYAIFKASSVMLGVLD